MKGWTQEKKFCSVQCVGAWRIKHGGPRSVSQGTVRKNYRKNKMDYSLVKVGRKWIPEHRIIMERVLGRSLSKEEVVHHKNGVKMDNIESNLQLCSGKSEHKRIHHEAELIGLSVMAANDWVPIVEGMGC